MAILALKSAVQHYRWGSNTLIPHLLGLESPSDKPWAELWMGAHPKAPSMVSLPEGEISLEEFIASNPGKILGSNAASRFGTLPFLFKFLAAGEPLSIQAHPAKARAEEGFARENAAGLSRDSEVRNYRDGNHKPEIITALTPFLALRGFRRASEITSLAEDLGAPVFLKIARHAQDGIRPFFTALIRFEEPALLVAEIVDAAAEREGELFRTLERLAGLYPADIGAAAPLYLNLVRLNPGEALFLPAGILHAYLEGLGIELMANSDNVLRGGLTHKHVDIPELLEVLTYEGGPAEVLTPEALSQGSPEEIYPAPAAEFALSRISLSPGEEYVRRTEGGCEILACAEGHFLIGGGAHLGPGKSLFITADQGDYTVRGAGRLYRASVPL
jgi:mannose-6-phosphate isomerase